MGDYVVGPGFTTYDKRTQYLVFDVTDRFSQPGRKTLVVTLADGWYGLGREPWGHNFHNNPYVDAPNLLLNLHVEHPDGTQTVVVSDESWKWSEREITYSWIAQEDVDRREAHESWNKTGDDDHGWRPVTVPITPDLHRCAARVQRHRDRAVLSSFFHHFEKQPLTPVKPLPFPPPSRPNARVTRLSTRARSPTLGGSFRATARLSFRATAHLSFRETAHVQMRRPTRPRGDTCPCLR